MKNLLRLVFGICGCLGLALMFEGCEKDEGPSFAFLNGKLGHEVSYVVFVNANDNDGVPGPDNANDSIDGQNDIDSGDLLQLAVRVANSWVGDDPGDTDEMGYVHRLYLRAVKEQGDLTTSLRVFREGQWTPSIVEIAGAETEKEVQLLHDDFNPVNEEWDPGDPQSAKDHYKLALYVEGIASGRAELQLVDRATKGAEGREQCISSPWLIVGIEVTNPDGVDDADPNIRVESWNVDVEHTITWNAPASVSFVDIEVHLDGDAGPPAQLTFPNQPAHDDPDPDISGSYAWTPVFGQVSDNCLILVRDSALTGTDGVSHPFRVTAGDTIRLYLDEQLTPASEFDDWPEDPVRGTLRSARYLLPPGGLPEIDYNRIYFRIPDIPTGIGVDRLQVVVESESSAEAGSRIVLGPTDLQLVNGDLRIVGDGVGLGVATTDRQILVVEEELLKFALQYDSTGAGAWVWVNDIDVMVDLAEASFASVYDYDLKDYFHHPTWPYCVTRAYWSFLVSPAKIMQLGGYAEPFPDRYQEIAQCLSSFGGTHGETDFLLALSHGREVGKFYGLQGVDVEGRHLATDFLPVTLAQEELPFGNFVWDDMPTNAEDYWGAGNYDHGEEHPKNVWIRDADWLISTACNTLYGGGDQAYGRWIRALQGYSDDGTGRCPHGILGFAGLSFYTEGWDPVIGFTMYETIKRFGELCLDFDPEQVPPQDLYTIVDAWGWACIGTDNPNWGWVCHWDDVEEGNTRDRIYDPSLGQPIFMTPDFAPGHDMWKATHSSVSTSVGTAVAGGAAASPEPLPRVLVVESAVDEDIIGYVQREAGVRIPATDESLFSGRRRAEARSEALALDDARRAIADIEGRLRAHHNAELGAVWVTKEGIGSSSSLAGNMRPVDYGFRFRHLHKGVPVESDFLHIRVDARGVAGVSGRWRRLREHEGGKRGLAVTRDEAIRVARKLRDRGKAEARGAEGAKASPCYVPVTTRAGELALKWKVEFDGFEHAIYVDEETLVRVEGE